MWRFKQPKCGFKQQNWDLSNQHGVTNANGDFTSKKGCFTSKKGVFGQQPERSIQQNVVGLPTKNWDSTTKNWSKSTLMGFKHDWTTHVRIEILTGGDINNTTNRTWTMKINQHPWSVSQLLWGLWVPLCSFKGQLDAFERIFAASCKHLLRSHDFGWWPELDWT